MGTESLVLTALASVNREPASVGLVVKSSHRNCEAEDDL